MAFSDRNYGDGDPYCSICNGLGYIRYDVPEEHPNFGRIFDCDCRKEKVEEQELIRLRLLGGLQYLVEKRLENFNPGGAGLSPKERDNLQLAYENALAYAQDTKGWLLIRGGYGCGKTHLAAGIANHCLEAGQRVLFVNTPDLLDALRSTYQPDPIDSYDARFEQVRAVPLLVLDDLGTESPTPWAREKLYQILNHRYNARLPTIVTTNHDLDELEIRLRSRLSDPDLVRQIVIIARDYRSGSTTPSHGNLNNLGLYQGMTFKTFSLRADEGLSDEQLDNLQYVLNLARAYAQNPQGWLVLLGDYGCGKTHLAAAIAIAQTDQGGNPLFITVPDLLDHLRATYSPNSLISYDKRLQEIKTSSLLVLDDLGTESATPWAREKLHQIFNHRYVAQLPTVITTAHEMENLDPRLAARLTDRRLCTIFAILAPAYHGKPNNRHAGC